MAKSQSEVNYREGTPEESCAGCAFFEPPEACTQVEGVVAPGGLCDLFTPGVGAEAVAPPPGPPGSLESLLFGGGLPQ